MTEYKQTLNLPQTDFPIRANLQNVEAEFTAFWAKEDIYHKIQEQRSKIQDQKTYILHDGPPYPNGDIHLGHALNKILKDIIVKYKSMSGFFAPYVPGWDCHGLPIETQLIKSIGDKRLEMDITEFREKCKEYALNYVDLQRTEFKRLGIFGEWDKPYLTINHSYEEKIVELFGVLAEKGYIYRGLKPIHWCPHCETALAEAEIEYEDDRSPSIHVKFEILNPKSEIIDKFKIQNPNLLNELTWNFIIWTTTPWTLPANVAIAANPEYDYVFLKTADQIYIIAEGLMEDFIKRLDLKDTQVVGKVKGKELEGLKAKHPFVEREVPLVLDRYVTLEQGTGLVHIAPGHGEEDYKVGLNYKLPIVMPVNEQGHFDDTVPEFIRGMFYVKANKVIGEHMQANGSLLKLEFFKHPYPHCWRCKKPVIFRATEQWFVAVDHNNMRQEALKAIKETKWFPGWGENRIRGMVETRPDWCISRQRSWGVPIPAFYCTKCNQPQMTGVFNQAIKELVAKEGTNAWFVKEVKDILPADTKCSCGGTEFTKEKDILDVWFESGSSHAAVLETTPDLQWPADLYLEGSDQHRGWFQTSLLLGIGYRGRAPFKAVLTHGFTIDDKGKKMSKSLGNVISPQDVVKEYGADILRLWVASTDFRNDMAASKKILKQVQEAYLKIRNTCRFLLSNLNDYQPDNAVAYSNLPEIDKWVLDRLQRLIKKVTKAYDDFEFHLVYHSLYDFCVNDLSAYYLDMSKDRLYCDAKDSIERCSAQYVCCEILTALVKLMAPILSFTAEDIYKYSSAVVSGQAASVFLGEMAKIDKEYLDDKLAAKWDLILQIREEVYKSIEVLRAKKEVRSSTQCRVTVYYTGPKLEALKSLADQLPAIFIVSEVILKEGDSKIEVQPSPYEKCQRCWMWKKDIGEDKKHPTLCQRCAAVVG
ncbi:isoleucine--tRNA ligase [candidate division WOR-1 bacterium RIFOXYB2_FULL_42_35]|uniref:Isoleucine--tRNA ligase n=1 Tax=candidate division WOR-1 bacterium RIFOXYC2_FULL_41_25 TaxID=1802586 RepID=A0A1F4TKL9_UNCSA|nr:MAG: isoleucine--tRNA ligase [candidate division WOR-1 bacterium RIFOXYA2_FULL_41_14]OGC22726.1 MAG: isoleucine--tRNA ligase [candidate division WOR-1 bacterium RIFOXYB2_FULL_42_35]OGC33147.1 MAG: isoleucine--tRNA ligase [candidate division WOR-1 bacterium RIFOXYC2_FULL_41_25]OGC44217.1 MAG: isoleucine--tRNA ligase [candidate division WOR-1 bacterium RIFOXYD2_FULL_41_8]